MAVEKLPFECLLEESLRNSRPIRRRACQSRSSLLKECSTSALYAKELPLLVAYTPRDRGTEKVSHRIPELDPRPEQCYKSRRDGNTAARDDSLPICKPNTKEASKK